jgi:lantibiotic transport system permease protein
MDEFEKSLDSMHKPQVESPTHQVQLRLTLLNAKRSAGIGIVLVIIPCLFLLGIFFTHHLHISNNFFRDTEDWMARKDHSLVIKLLIPLLLIGAPLAALAMNLLAILHFELNQQLRELIVTIKIKWFNIIISLICLLIVLCFFLYGVAENL